MEMELPVARPTFTAASTSSYSPWAFQAPPRARTRRVLMVSAALAPVTRRHSHYWLNNSSQAARGHPASIAAGPALYCKAGEAGGGFLSTIIAPVGLSGNPRHQSEKDDGNPLFCAGEPCL